MPSNVDDHPLADEAAVPGDDYMAGYLQDELELDLLALGGQQLLDDARFEAGDYVDQEYPWDGAGDEPPEQVSAWLAMLWQQAEQARGEIAARNGTGPIIGSRTSSCGPGGSQLGSA
jgi:hypothetical protein